MVRREKVNATTSELADDRNHSTPSFMIFQKNSQSSNSNLTLKNLFLGFDRSSFSSNVQCLSVCVSGTSLFRNLNPYLSGSNLQAVSKQFNKVIYSLSLKCFV